MRDGLKPAQGSGHCPLFSYRHHGHSSSKGAAFFNSAIQRDTPIMRLDCLITRLVGTNHAVMKLQLTEYILRLLKLV